MVPGLIAFTCTPSRSLASAIVLVKESSAALTEPPMVNCRPGVRPPMPEMKISEPADFFGAQGAAAPSPDFLALLRRSVVRGLAERCGHAARVSRTAPKNFKANPSAQSPSDNA